MHPEAVHFLAAVPFVIPERQLVTFPCMHRGRLVRCAIDGPTLALLWRRPASVEVASAFAACRGKVEALMRRLLSEGRGASGGLCVTAEDVLPLGNGLAPRCPGDNAKT
jgi:hypothetical protein